MTFAYSSCLMFEGALRNKKMKENTNIHKCLPLVSFSFRDVKNGYDDAKQAHQKYFRTPPHHRSIINDVIQSNFLLKAHLYSRNFRVSLKEVVKRH